MRDDDDNVVKLPVSASGLVSSPIGGTDLEIAVNRRGNDLVVQVNKGGVQVFRALLSGACAEMSYEELVGFSTFSPDVHHSIGQADEAQPGPPLPTDNAKSS